MDVGAALSGRAAHWDSLHCPRPAALFCCRGPGHGSKSHASRSYVPAGLSALGVGGSAVEHSRDSAHPPQIRKEEERRRNRTGEWQERGRGREEGGRTRRVETGLSHPCHAHSHRAPARPYRVLGGWGGRCRACGDTPRTHRGRSQGDQHEGVPLHCGAEASQGGSRTHVGLGFIKSTTFHLFFRRERSERTMTR